MAVFNDSPHAPIVKAGYGSEKKARNTIRRLRTLTRTRRITRTKAKQVARTMYYRAKYHKYQTNGMKNAMKVYENYIKHTTSVSGKAE